MYWVIRLSARSLSGSILIRNKLSWPRFVCVCERERASQREIVCVCECVFVWVYALSRSLTLSRALSLSRARTPSQVTLHRSLESEYAKKRSEAVRLKQEWAQQVCSMSICIYLFIYTCTDLYTNTCTHMHTCMHAATLCAWSKSAWSKSALCT